MPSSSIDLLAVYDFANSPTSFDFLSFLARAEIEKRQNGANSISVLFVLNGKNSFWQSEGRSDTEHRKRLENLLIPLCQIWEIKTEEKAHTRLDAQKIISNWRGPIFPHFYNIQMPPKDEYQWAHLVAEHCTGVSLPLWQSNKKSQQQIQNIIKPDSRTIATITLRESSDGRKSNFVAWAQLAKSLRSLGHRPIFLRDTDAMNIAPPLELSGEEFCNAASSDPILRGALYEFSNLCLMHSNGPMQMLWLGAKTRSMVFGISNSDFTQGCAVPIRSMGLNINSPLPMHMGRHKIIWEDDKPDVLQKHIQKINRAISRRDLVLENAVPERPLEIARRLRNTYRLPAAEKIYQYIRQGKGSDGPGGRAGLALSAAKNGSLSYLKRRILFIRHFFGFIHFSQGEVSGEAASELALAYRIAGMRSRSEIFAAKCVESPDSSLEAKAQALSVLSANKLDTKNYRIAEKLLNDACELAPFEVSYPIALAALYSKQGQKNQYLKWIKIVRSLDPSLKLT